MNITSLPSDVIRKIVIFGQASANSMSLISFRWNALVCEHITVNRHLLPVIDQFCFRMETKDLMIILLVDDTYRDYFGVAKWSCLPIENSQVYVKKEIRSVNDKIVKHLLLLFGRCARIGRLVFKIRDIDCSEKNAIAGTMHILSGVKFDELAFENLTCFDEFISNTILSVIRKRPVKKLLLAASDDYSIRNLDFDNIFGCGEFLVDAMEFLSKLEIRVFDSLDKFADPARFYDYWDSKISLIHNACTLMQKGTVKMETKPTKQWAQVTISIEL